MSDNTLCSTDEFCASKINNIYYCDSSTGTCNRTPVIQKLTWKSSIGLLLIFILIPIAFIISLSPNSISMPLLVLLFDFIFKDTLAILKMANLIPSIFNFGLIANLRNPKKKNKLYTNFDLILFVYPLILSGSIAGTLLLLITPPAVSYCIVFIMLIIVCIGNFKKYQEIKNKYESVSGEDLEDQKVETKALIKSSIESEKSFCYYIYEVKHKVFLIILALIILIFAYLVKGSSSKTSIINGMECSKKTLGLFLLFCIPLVLISLFGYKKLMNSLQENSDTANNSKIGIIMGMAALLGGFMSTTGVGGSLFISSSLLLLNIEPLVIKCTMTWISVLMSTNNTFQFMFIGYFDWKNVLIFTSLELCGCIFSNLFIKKLVAKSMSEKANKIIALCCCFMCLFVCCSIPFTIYSEYVHNKSFMKSGGIC